MTNILFINHHIKNCGVYQYGYRSAQILQKSKKYNFLYLEITNAQDYFIAVETHKPAAIIYNNHGPVMPWLSPNILKTYPNIVHIGIFHEGPQFYSYGYDYGITQDSTLNDTPTMFSVPRPLLEDYYVEPTIPEIVTINSFGFSFNDKGFDKIVAYVCNNFDRAIINLHTPSAFFDRPKHETQEMFDACKSSKTNPNVDLNITTNFLSEKELLTFLSSSTINFFPYAQAPGRGISSVIDYALSVDKPIAITKSEMFRHIYNTQPSICIEDRSIKDIINSGTSPLLQYKEKWSNKNFILKYEYIISSILKEKNAI